jgi:hypothetical protein
LSTAKFSALRTRISSNGLVSIRIANIRGLPSTRDHFSSGELFFRLSTFSQLMFSRISSCAERSAVICVAWSLMMR